MKMFLAKKIQEQKIVGRTHVLEYAIAIFWSASGIELNVRAGELWARIDSNFSTHEVWIAIFVDGAQTARLMLAKGRNEICVFRNMNPDIVKNVRIYKEIQTMERDALHNMILKNFRTDGIFLPVENAGLKIEFIGDSRRNQNKRFVFFFFP